MGETPETPAPPAIDPTKNVLDHVRAAVQRLDDLRAAKDDLYAAQIGHVKEIGDLRARHAAEMRTAESSRLDSIRQVDVQQAAREASSALVAIQTLAAQVITKDEAMRSLVASTATTLAASTQATNAHLSERVAALEKTANQAGGKSAGFSSSWAILLGALGVGVALYMALRPH